MVELNVLMCELKEYIDQNLVLSEVEESIFISDISGKDITKSAEFSAKDAKDLEELIGELGETFHEMLFRKIRESGLPETDVYKRANIDRKFFSKIRSNPAYHPRKGIVLALAFALKLDLEETAEFLAKAEYALSPGSKGDLIVKYCIEKNIYDLDSVNCMLYKFEQPLLGSCGKGR